MSPPKTPKRGSPKRVSVRSLRADSRSTAAPTPRAKNTLPRAPKRVQHAKPPKRVPQRSNAQSRSLKGLPPPGSVPPRVAEDGAVEVLPQPERSLLDVVDNLINQGVVISGDAVLGVADVDLVYLKLSVLLCAVDRLTQ